MLVSLAAMAANAQQVFQGDWLFTEVTKPESRRSREVAVYPDLRTDSLRPSEVKAWKSLLCSCWVVACDHSLITSWSSAWALAGASMAPDAARISERPAAKMRWALAWQVFLIERIRAVLVRAENGHGCCWVRFNQW